MIIRNRLLHALGVGIVIFIFVSLAMVAPSISYAAHTVLHHFTGGTNDGQDPRGSLTLAGSTFYGMTHDGGAGDEGIIFRMNIDGTGFEILHSFTVSVNDGREPESGSLVVSGSVLFGMTPNGGANGHGTIFRMNVDGTGYQLLHSFDGVKGHGMHPTGSLVLSESTLYGMTSLGALGINEYGTIFKISTDGTGFEVLHSFSGSDGWEPLGSLTLSGPSLYGMTSSGGNSGIGTVFRIDTNGTNFQVLHHFSGDPDDGANPLGSLTLAGSSLYGMTSFGGGTDRRGTIFLINTDGTDYQTLHKFGSGSPPYGFYPWGSLILSRSVLYGMTSQADGIPGTIFQINTDGTGYRILHGFRGSPGDGAFPQGDLVLSGDKLYGMTPSGGSHEKGVIFSHDLPKAADAVNLLLLEN